jgi:hypothetical protein
LQPAAHPERLAGEVFEVDAGGGEGARPLALDAYGEIAPPVLGEIEIDPSAALVPSTS